MTHPARSSNKQHPECARRRALDERGLREGRLRVGPLQHLAPVVPEVGIPIDKDALRCADPSLGGVAEAHRLRVRWTVERRPGQPAVVAEDEGGALVGKQPSMALLRVTSAGDPPALRGGREVDRPATRRSCSRALAGAVRLSDNILHPAAPTPAYRQGGRMY